MFERLGEKFKWMDGHHRIERFGVTFGCLCLAFCVLLATIFVKASHDQDTDFAERVMYNSEFAASLSGLSGTVEHVYVSKDHTQVFALLKFADGSEFSTNAENYRMGVGGITTTKRKEPLRSNPSGAIYMFGSTGYMGIYLIDTGVFPLQLMNVIVRCSVVLNQGGTGGAGMGASFSNNDQFQLFFNPGASNIETCDFLENGTLDAYSIYEEVISRPREQELRAKLDEDLASMRHSQQRMAEFAAELSSSQNRILVKDPPVTIQGDEIIMDENGVLVYKGGMTPVLATGYDFDWRGGTVRDGYLADLTGGMSAAQWMTAKSKEVELFPFSSSMSTIERESWMYMDGSVFEANNDIASSKAISNSIASLMNEWRTYYDLKLQYQTQDLRDLLLLELNTTDVMHHNTMNTNMEGDSPVLSIM